MIIENLNLKIVILKHTIKLLYFQLKCEKKKQRKVIPHMNGNQTPSSCLQGFVKIITFLRGRIEMQFERFISN